MNNTKAGTDNHFDGKIFARNVLHALGSLRITVFLLTLGLLLVWIATLQQTRRDIYQVKQEHFRGPVVFIEFQEVLPPAWFPELQDVGGGFLMPSGAALLIAMLLNLLCAHSTRFRLQASGKRLLIGSFFLIAGIVTTLLVVSNGNSSGKFQEQPLIGWATQWKILQGLLGAAAMAGLLGAVYLESSVRRTFSFVAGLVLAGLLAFLLYQGQSAFIGNDAMRVVWRLVQGSVAAIVVYIGALMVFRRKAGIVVIHTGLLLLMVGELYTSYTAVEQRLFFFEGDTTQHTVDVNKIEVAFIQDVGDSDLQNVVSIPSRRLAVDGTLDVEDVSVRIETVAFYPNSELLNIKPGDHTVPGAMGIAKFVFAEKINEVAGTDGNTINSPSAYVKLTDLTNNKDLGTWLISQRLYRDSDYDLDSIVVDGKTWQIGLRFKHFYKPYLVTLNSTTRVNYTGTKTPRSYSSNFRIVDADHNVDEVKEVSMNKPLRYNNETFYQSGHDTDPLTGRQYSVLQVVRNTGWMIPYVSCAMVGIGLLLHFLGTFLRFVERLAKSRTPSTRYDKISWAFAGGFVLLLAMFVYRKVPDPVVVNDINLERYGQVSVAFGGRVQPLDTIARTTLRQSRNFEIPVKWDREKKKEIKYPPMQWLADWVFGADGSDEYRIFKIGDPGINQALSLINRKSHLFSIKELEAVKPELDKYVAAANVVKEQDESSLTAFQKRILKLARNIDRVKTLRYTLGPPIAFAEADPIKTLEWVINSVRTTNDVPRIVPGETKNDWSVLTPLLAPAWIKSLCDEYGTTLVDEVARKMVETKSLEQFQDILLRRELGRSLVELSELDPANVNEARLDDIVETMLTTDDPEMQDRMKSLTMVVQPRVDAFVEIQVESMSAQVAEELAQFVHVQDGRFDFDKTDSMPLTRLPTAYLASNAAEFNEAVDQHMEQALEKRDVSENSGKVTCESALNRLSPFYFATAIYIAAFVLSLLSWLFLTGAQTNELFSSLATGARRGAFWLIVFGFAFHTAGLLMRIYVSGRPPVTNLYGSAVFIGWVGILFGLVTEKMIGYCFGNITSSFAGVTTLLTAFALGTEGDTFSVLQAVLDTQFWLSTHVVSITIGYASTLVAGLLGVLYLVTSMLIPRDLTDVRKTLAKMVYGVTCLALIFSFVGTVLGGLWADDSWGRFWGWDPKENGALMIVLVNAMLLHSRWAGLVKDRGIAVIAIGGVIVTLWSWFAVNELGIGLHTYGLTEGRMKVVGLSWLSLMGLMLAAAIPTRYWLGNRAASKNRDVDRADAPTTSNPAKK